MAAASEKWWCALCGDEHQDPRRENAVRYEGSDYCLECALALGLIEPEEGDGTAAALLKEHLKRRRKKALTWTEEVRQHGPYVYACIGSDRSTGDSLGPLVGTFLVEAGVGPVFGTLSEPLHAGMLRNALPALHAKAAAMERPILAIDSALGRRESVGTFEFRVGPGHPGAGIHKDLPAVGDYHLNAMVNVAGYMEYVVLQQTSLATVYQMAREVVAALGVFR